MGKRARAGEASARKQERALGAVSDARHAARNRAEDKCSSRRSRLHSSSVQSTHSTMDALSVPEETHRDTYFSRLSWVDGLAGCPR